MTGQPVRQLSVAPGDSLEAQAFAGRDSDIAYLSLKDLRKLGSIPAPAWFQLQNGPME
jgi:hypothetical protein